MKSVRQEIIRWRHGVRLYIAIGIGLLTLEAWWWAAALYGGGTLFATRLEEVFGWLAFAMIGIAVLIGPFYRLWPAAPGGALMRDARRLFGVGGAWFAALHVGISYGLLFKWANPLSLPLSYQRSFAAGILALVVLLAMAFTSFDRAMRGMGIWWFRLHRLVYAALCLMLLHVFVTGTHAVQLMPLVLLSAAAFLVIGMHAAAAFSKGRRPSKWQIGTIAAVTLLTVGILGYGYAQHFRVAQIEKRAVGSE